ncbi:Maf/Ham1 [Mitosporidium daphniae]|uniref:Maf/Ham1 n=1 Tax=Mitosporidium daphniae TaxID=1485682 RepID=A0A098VU04_9MICR|nr:Maf/Ham1 [Mitosporidium daphniae]KGG52437.1 Maf/Ham1 [Mitosporidium daphniae]|eukprot:XP_013238873.1 Maf/Ham1 [Mitosporidium daphniae]
MRIAFATGNANKLSELQQILNGVLEVDAISLDSTLELGCIRDIAVAKSKEAFKIIGRPVLTDDTSLTFSAFGGELPGWLLFFIVRALY